VDRLEHTSVRMLRLVGNGVVMIANSATAVPATAVRRARFLNCIVPVIAKVVENVGKEQVNSAV